MFSVDFNFLHKTNYFHSIKNDINVCLCGAMLKQAASRR